MNDRNVLLMNNYEDIIIDIHHIITQLMKHIYNLKFNLTKISLSGEIFVITQVHANGTVTIKWLTHFIEQVKIKCIKLIALNEFIIRSLL